MTEIQNPLDALLKPTFDVPSVTHEGVTFECRDLPSTTIMFTITVLASSFNEAIKLGRKEFIETLVELSTTKQDTSTQDIMRVMSMAQPLILKAAMSTPELLERILTDVVMNATTKHIEAISAIDALEIFSKAFARVDADWLAGKLKDVFSHATGIWKKTIPQKNGQQADAAQAKNEEEEEEPLTSPSQGQLQE